MKDYGMGADGGKDRSQRSEVRGREGTERRQQGMKPFGMDDWLIRFANGLKSTRKAFAAFVYPDAGSTLLSDRRGKND